MELPIAIGFGIAILIVAVIALRVWGPGTGVSRERNEREMREDLHADRGPSVEPPEGANP